MGLISSNFGLRVRAKYTEEATSQWHGGIDNECRRLYRVLTKSMNYAVCLVLSTLCENGQIQLFGMMSDNTPLLLLLLQRHDTQQQSLRNHMDWMGALSGQRIAICSSIL